jgi:KTSC domain
MDQNKPFLISRNGYALIKRQAVDSEAIFSVGYEPEKQELDIEFRPDRDVYRYFDVPPEEYSSFMAADSLGKYVNKVIKPKYRCVRIKKGKKTA